MAEEVVFRLRTEGGSQAAGDIGRVSGEFGKLAQSAAETNTATVALAKTLNTSFSGAQKLAQSLGLTATEASKAAARINELRAAGATGAQAFEAISREVGVTQEQFKQLSAQLKDPFGALDLDGLPNKFGATTAEIEQQAQALRNLEQQAELTSQGFQAIALGGTAIAGTIALLGGNALQTGARFEQLQSALDNAFGSAEAGAREFERIQEFAASTPFSVDQLTTSFLTLVNRGFVPTNEELTKLGDLAASQAKDFSQLTEALLDAQTGEFERLKEFGIQASRSGDQVTFSFRGLQQTVANTPEAISQVILGFGELEGIQGSLAAQSATLGGQFSNLQDGLDQVSVSFFEFAEGPAKAVLSAANTLIGGFLDLPAPIQGALFAVTGFTAILGAAIAALASYNLAVQSSTVQALGLAAAQIRTQAATILSTSAKTAAIAVETAYALATGRATAAQVAQAGALVSSAAKIGLFAAAIAAVAVNINTFNRVNAAANETRQGIDELDKAIQSLKQAQADLGDTGAAGLDALTDSLEANRSAIEDNIGGLDAFLDRIRSVVGASTAAEAAVNAESIAFGELVQRIDGEVLGAFDRLRAAPGGLGAAAGAELDALSTAIETSIAQLEAERPVSAEAAAARQVYINSLKRAQSELEATTQAAIANADATELQGAALEEFRRQAATQLDQQNADNERAIARQIDDERAARQEATQARIEALQEAAQERISAQQEADARQLQTVEATFEQQQQQLREDSAAKIREAERAFDLEADQRKRDFQDREREIQEAENKAFEQEQQLIDNQLRLEQLRNTNLLERTQQLDAEERQIRQEIELAAANPLERFGLEQRFRREDEQFERRQAAELEFADELAAIEERRLQQQFEQEQALAARRAELEAPLIAARAAAEEQRRQAEIAFNQQEDQRRLEFEQNVLLPLQQQLEATLQQSRLDFETNVLQPLKAQQEEQLKALRIASEQEIAAAKRAAADEERRLDRQQEDEKIARERAFKEEQRRLDVATAEQILQILRQAGIQTPNGAPRQLRKGGNVGAGEVVQLHKDELVYFGRDAAVLSQQRSRQLIAQQLQNQAFSPVKAIAPMTAQTTDPRLIKAVVRGFEDVYKRLGAIGRPQQEIYIQQGAQQSMDQVFALMRSAAKY